MGSHILDFFLLLLFSASFCPNSLTFFLAVKNFGYLLVIFFTLIFKSQIPQRIYTIMTDVYTIFEWPSNCIFI